MSLPLTFLLGAGASFPFGIPVMRQFYLDFEKHVTTVRPHCSEFLSGLKMTWSGQPDLETLLSTLEDLVLVGDRLHLAGPPTPEQQKQFGFARELRGYLDSFLIETCERFDNSEVAKRLQSFVKLSHLHPTWVFTTNYDRIVEVACTLNGVGYSDGFFTEASKPVAEWRGAFDCGLNLVKLHGSVNWYEEEKGKAIHRLEKGYSLPSHEFSLSRAEQRLRPLMIVPTQEKAALRMPYAELGVRFIDVLKETKLLVVIGNSLRDSHIFNFIKTRLETLNVLLVGPAASTQKRMFDDADNIHAIDAGFLEYLAASAQPLQKLLVQLQALPFPDRAAAQAAVAAHASEMRECVARLARDHLPPEVERMLQRAETTDIATRCRAIRELSQYPHPKVIQNLQNLILSENRPEIQTSAIDTLAVIDGPGCIDVFGKALLEAKSDDVKNEAALALLPLAATYPAAAAFLAEASKGDLNAVLCDILTPLHKTT